MKKAGFWGLAVLLAGMSLAALEPVALVSDPPPAVDGSLDRLSKLAGQQALSPEKNTVYGRENCGDANDFSGGAVLGYDHNFLYLGVTVRDDQLVQKHTQGDLWKGDHAMLVVQYPYLPGKDDKNIYVFGFSPGNFAGIAPEAWVFRPEGTPNADIRVAAQRDSGGYRLEAAIPWSVFNAPAPAIHDRLRFDTLLSDSDSGEQDTLLSQSARPAQPRPWDLARLIDGVFARADGSFDSGAVKTAALWNSEPGRLEKGKSTEIVIPPEVAKRAQSLTVRMAFDRPQYAGGTRGGRLELNGKPLDAARCLNRDANIQFEQHDMGASGGDGVWFTTYGPLDSKGYPAFSSNGTAIDPNEFVFDVSDLLKPEGPNKLIVAHRAQTDCPLSWQVSASEFKMPANRLTLKDAPTGELPVIEPAHRAKPGFYQVKLDAEGAVAVTVNGRTYRVESEFSTLKPDWARFGAPGDGAVTVKGDTAELKSKDFTVSRVIERQADCIAVKDTVTNLSGTDLPLMVRNFTAVTPEAKVFVAGYPKISASSRNAAPVNPTSLALEKTSGIGLVAEDDLSRIQGYNYCNDGKLGMADERLVLTPGKTVTLEFSVYPLEKPEQYVFINRIRDNWGVNFTIDGPGCFLSSRLTTAPETLKRQLDSYSAKYGIFAVTFIYGKDGGVAQHGNRYTQIDLSYLNDSGKKVRQAKPDVKVFTYFHCFISNGDGDKETFADDALIAANGEVVDYSGGKYPIFVPRPGSKFAAMQDKVIDLRFDQGIDAIYWDELEYSKSPFSYSDKYWDGVSAEIDGKTHRISRKISSVPILTESWRLAMIDKLLKRGNGLLIANGAPFTKAMRERHFPRFVETGSITNLVQAQLYTPISLGDHLTVRTPLDAYKDMLKALNYGSVYYYYADTVGSAPTLTDAMYPITPVALGQGCIIGQERILTNTSGLFGWGDRSDFTARVFDRTGREKPDFKVPKIERDGKVYAEVRIPEGYGVALIRK